MLLSTVPSTLASLPRTYPSSSSRNCLFLMFNFGDELTIQSYGIPWLIWIQLLVMFLIIVLLYCCSIITFELSDGSSASETPSIGLFSSGQSCIDKPILNSAAGKVTSSSHHAKGGGSLSRRGERPTNTSRRIAGAEDILQGEHISFSENSYHPCYIIRLAKEVFLKCFGLNLDSTSNNSSNAERRRES